MLHVTTQAVELGHYHREACGKRLGALRAIQGADSTRHGLCELSHHFPALGASSSHYIFPLSFQAEAGGLLALMEN